MTDDAMDRVRWALDEIQRHPSVAHFVGPQHPADIDVAARELGVLFSPSYRAFLGELGAGSFAGGEVYGVVGRNRAVGPPSVVWCTLAARADFGLPRRFIVVRDYDDSSASALDVASPVAAAGEDPVVRIWPGEPAEENLVAARDATSFGAFFEAFVRERLAVITPPDADATAGA
jgi:hypothetical protein